MRSFYVLVALGAIISSHIARSAGVPKVPKEPDVPETPATPEVPDYPGSPGTGKPIGHPDLSPAGSNPASNPNAVPPQEQLQSNMDSLEEKLEKVQDIVENVSDLVDAFLSIYSGSAASSTGDADSLAVASSVLATTTADITFTPTTTLPAASFTACQSYASILSSCASATSLFNSLNPTSQASCACYSSTIASVPCESTGSQMATVPTLALSRFDDAANACYDYFHIQGYHGIADAMSGHRNNQTVLGAGFCGNIDSAMKKSTNASTGLRQSGVPSAYTFCSSSNTEFKGGTTRTMGLTLFDRAVFASLSIVMIAFPFAMFG